MEDHRRDIVIIFAGYTRKRCTTTGQFRSADPTTFDFEDYSPDEIVEIGLLLVSRKQELPSQLFMEKVA